MTAALKYLSQIANEIFESQLRRAALRISARQHFVLRRAA